MNAVARMRRLPGVGRFTAREEAWTWAGLVVLVLVGCAVIYIAGRGSTFLRDDWNFILTRRGHSPDVFLRPHNGHAVPLHLLAWKALLQVVGLKSYVPYRLLSLVLHVTVVVLLFVFARRRVGAPAALAATAVLAIPGIGGGDEVLWAFQIGFLGAIAAGIGMLLALERGDRRGDLIACVLLGVALASSGVGAAVAIAAFVEIILGPDRRGRLIRVLAVPLALYGLWKLAYGGEVPRELVPATEFAKAQPLKDNILDAPAYVAKAAAVALAATMSLPRAFGYPLALGAGALVVLRVLDDRPLSPRLWGLLAMAVGYWGLLALTRGQWNDFGAARYVYPGVAFILLVILEWVRGLRLSRRGLVVLAVAATAIVAGNIGALKDQGYDRRLKSQASLAQLAALEIARDRVDPAFRPTPDPAGLAPDVAAQPYFAAIYDFGSPAPTPAELAEKPDWQRMVADATLLQALRVRPKFERSRAVSLTPPHVLAERGGSTRVDRGCAVLSTAGDRAVMELRVPRAGLSVTGRPGGPVELRARRLASGFGNPFARVTGGKSAVLRFPRDRLSSSWDVQLAARRSVRACAL